MFSATITIIWKPDANLATSFTGNVRMQAPMVTPVIIIAQCGVSNFLFVSANESGSKLSFAIANRKRDAANNPDRAPEIIVRKASVASAKPTFVEATASTNAKIGSSLTAPSLLSHHSPSTAAIITNVTKT